MICKKNEIFCIVSSLIGKSSLKALGNTLACLSHTNSNSHIKIMKFEEDYVSVFYFRPLSLHFKVCFFFFLMFCSLEVLNS